MNDNDLYEISNTVFSGGFKYVLYNNEKYPIYYKNSTKDPYDAAPSNEPINIIENDKTERKIKLFIDLNTLDKSKSNYDPSKFPGAKIRFELNNDLGATFLFFSTSRFVCTGLKKPDMIKDALNLLTEFLNNNNIIVIEPFANIVNIVANASIGNNIDLNSTVVKLNDVIYEPEVFPGVIYHHNLESVVNKKKAPKNYTRSVALIFMSGKAVITGIKDFDSLSFIVKDLRDLMKQKNLSFNDNDLQNGDFELDLDKLI